MMAVGARIIYDGGNWQLDEEKVTTKMTAQKDPRPTARRPPASDARKVPWYELISLSFESLANFNATGEAGYDSLHP